MREQQRRHLADNTKSMPKPDAETQKSATVIQAEIDEKVAAGYISQAIDVHAYKLLEIPGGVWAVRTLRRLLLQNNLIEVRPCRLTSLPWQEGVLMQSPHCPQLTLSP